MPNEISDFLTPDEKGYLEDLFNKHLEDHVYTLEDSYELQNEGFKAVAMMDKLGLDVDGILREINDLITDE